MRLVVILLASMAASAALTAAFVQTGLDWAYFVWIQGSPLVALLWPADIVGYIAPFAVVLALAIATRRAGGSRDWSLPLAAVLATLGGLAVSVGLKSITGRVSPPHHAFGEALTSADNSAMFQFGFLNQPIIGGWPSSHATISFAVLVAVVLVAPIAKRPRLVIYGLPVAAFIGLGVTFGFHWLSEFVSGVLIGSAVGYCVAATLNAPETSSAQPVPD